MANKSVLIITGLGMQSVTNECLKIKETFLKKGYECDLIYYQKTPPSRTPKPKYDLTIWFTPLLPMYMPVQRRYLNIGKTNLVLNYYVIEGIVHHMKPYLKWLEWQYIATPSNFAKSCLEEMGIKVKEVIPHQINNPMSIDFQYGKKWRSKFPSDKKILLYNGSQIVRKALWKLNEAIKILSARRNDFLMVYHTDNINAPYHTPIRQLNAPNTVIETDFCKLSLSQVYGKMYFSDIIVHPAFTEGFGLPVLEALALEKPLVCINAYGVNEIANPKNSFMVTNTKPSTLEWKGYLTFKIMDYEPRDLADKIEEALDASKDIIDDKLANARETVKKFVNTYDRFTKFL